MAEALGRDVAARIFDILPAAASEFITRRLVLPQMSIVVSNVRGPDVPLFMAGARLVNFAPVSIAFDGLGLNVTGFSYNGTLWICFVACRDMLPDPAFFADCLRNAFHSLEHAALQQAPRHEPARRASRSRADSSPRAPQGGKTAADERCIACRTRQICRCAHGVRGRAQIHVAWQKRHTHAVVSGPSGWQPCATGLAVVVFRILTTVEGSAGASLRKSPRASARAAHDEEDSRTRVADATSTARERGYNE